MRRPKLRKPRDIRRDDDEQKPKRPLDPERVRARTLQRAIKLLAAKPRSIAELRERLMEKEWADEAAGGAAIPQLQEDGYLDDERVAVGYAPYRVKQPPVPRARLRRA